MPNRPPRRRSRVEKPKNTPVYPAKPIDRQAASEKRRAFWAERDAEAAAQPKQDQQQDEVDPITMLRPSEDPRYLPENRRAIQESSSRA